MLVNRPMLRAALLLSGLLSLAPMAVAQTPAGTPGETAAPAAEEPKIGPVEELYKQRQYEEALRKADELQGQKKTDVENEYWAARALRALERFPESAERFRQVSKNYPGTELAASADVDALIALLGDVPEGEQDAASKKKSTDVGVQLLEVARQHAATRPETQARALYIAGNAFRMAHADAQAAAAYAECRELTVAHPSGYPDKCTLGLGSIRARNWQEAEALALYRECALQDRDGNTAKRCSKSLARTELVGHPAPALQMETWLNSEEQSLEKLKGNVVMLFFFATWCPHCKATLPTLPRYLEKYEGKPFRLMALTNNVRGQTTESASLFIKDPQWNIQYPVGVDANGATTMALEASGIPQIILIDKKGVVRWSDHPAYLSDSMIDTLMAEPGGA